MTEFPTDWRKVAIGKLAKVNNGGTPSRKVARYWENGIYPWLPTKKVNDRIITFADEFVSQAAMDECSVRIFPAGSVLVGMIGQGKTRGKVAYLEIDAAINQNFGCISPKPALDGKYLFQFLEQSYEKLRDFSHGSNQGALNCSLIADFPILVPPLEEQRKIAEILGTWDEAIAQVAQLIAALQQRKKGLMQRLLTGQVRFPEFEGKRPGKRETKFGTIPADWDYKPIGAIAKSVSKKNGKAKELPVLSCTKYDGLVDSLEYFGRQIFPDDTSSYKVVSRNQFAYATNHIEEGSIGYQNLYEEALISPMYTVFQTNSSINDAFLYRVLKTELYRHIFETRTTGTVDRRGSLRWNEFSQISVPIPSLAEQNRIVELFETVDHEIAVAEKQHVALQQQKKGLMQRLLTGQIRVNTNQE